MRLFQSAIGMGPFLAEPKNSCGGAGVNIMYQYRERFGTNQGRIGIKDQHDAVKAFQKRLRLYDGVAGAARRLLHGDGDIGPEGARRLGDPFALCAHNDNCPLGRKLGRCLKHMRQHRTPANLMQDFRRRRTHARAVTGGQHDDGE